MRRRLRGAQGHGSPISQTPNQPALGAAHGVLCRSRRQPLGDQPAHWIEVRRVGEPHGHPSALHLGYGYPACGAGARTVSIWPVRDPPAIFSAPFHSVATINSVFLSAPPSIQAKHPRSSSIVCTTSPPSRTRTQRLLPTSAYQRAPSASRQIPSG